MGIPETTAVYLKKQRTFVAKIRSEGGSEGWLSVFAGGLELLRQRLSALYAAEGLSEL